MSYLLHILTIPEDALAAQMIPIQREQAGHEVKVVDLTKPDADYRALLEEIFAADSVQVW